MQEMTVMEKPFVMPDQKSSKPRNIKYNNQKLVMSLFRWAGKLSVSEISEQVGLSKTTIKKIIGDLMKKNMLLSAGKGESTEEGGKKPELFIFNPAFRYIVLVNIPITHVRVSILDLNAREVFCLTQETDPHHDSYPEQIRCAAECTLSALNQFGIEPEQLCGIMICGDGIVDSKRGIIRYSVHHHWPGNLPVLEDFAKEFPYEVPLYVENAGALCGYADLLDPSTRELHTIVHLFVDRHSCGCVLRDGKLQNGAHGFMSEFGHITADPRSELTCVCGSKGCFEVLAAPEQVLRQTGELLSSFPDSQIAQAAQQGKLTMKQLFEAAEAGEPCARQSMEQVIRWFAVLIRSIMIFHDPQKILIQGTYQEAGPYFLKKLREAVLSTPFFQAGEDLLIDFAPYSFREALTLSCGYYVGRNFLETDSLYD